MMIEGYDKFATNDKMVQKYLLGGFINIRVWPETYTKQGEADFFNSKTFASFPAFITTLERADYCCIIGFE